MGEEKIINVGLYGGKSLFGGKETPLEASIVYCDRCEKCSFFKNNQCLNVRGFMASYCKFGRVSTVKGYTSRARKYNDFRDKWRYNANYGKLNRPSEKLGIIDNVVVFPYSHVTIHEDEATGKISVQDPSFSSHNYFIDLDKFTVDLIYDICTFRPQALFGGTIRSYQEKTVPLFLEHLREVIPDKYNEFVKAYPKYDKKPNYIGRRALLKTVKPSSVNYISKNYPDLNSEWFWDGQYLIYKKGYISSFSVVQDYNIGEIKLIPGDTAGITITDNDQVSNDTVFLD